jgi:hypothetical protein
MNLSSLFVTTYLAALEKTLAMGFVVGIKPVRREYFIAAAKGARIQAKRNVDRFNPQLPPLQVA